MKHYIKQLYPNVTRIKAIGNHELLRHEVFEIDVHQRTYIIKFFHKKRRYTTELTVMKLVETTEVPSPKIIDHGILGEQEYIVMSKLPGRVLEHVKDITEAQYRKVLIEAGQYLRMIHSIPVTYHFGRVATNYFETHEAAMRQQMVNIIHELLTFDHPKPEVIHAGVALAETMHYPPCQKKLCHMDYNDRNILVDWDGKDYVVTGIIDYEQCQITDISREMTYIQNKYQNEQAFAYILEGYGETIETLPVYKLQYGLAICAWSLHVAREFYDLGLKLIEESIEAINE